VGKRIFLTFFGFGFHFKHSEQLWQIYCRVLS